MTESNAPKSEPDVRNAAEARRYEITADGELAGFAQYVDDGAKRIFFHTEIDERFGGRGLAGVLVGHALADARDSGMRIVPVCPFVKKYLEKHHDFDDVLDPVTPAALSAVDKRER